ncbi:MAG: hypothetical protein KJO69_08030 [Gammaproteobacteria bacterium]|nr:hypothetical protein [Gammaproteobacteria bacterium]NNJ73523.1 hypothetical protein [Enterobacterales bacterium]
MRKGSLVLVACSALLPMSVAADMHNKEVSMDVINKQNEALAVNTNGKGFGPQSPRDIDAVEGTNARMFSTAPKHTEMNLCNIHFHKFAEHKGGEYTTYAGPGNGKGYETGYKYSGELSKAEMKPAPKACMHDTGSLSVGDTIELHYVHTTAQVQPGPTLGACLSESIMNPQLRVEAQVYVLVNDENALDFNDLTEVKQVNGYYQSPNIPSNTGTPVAYAGSTTGPSYNEQGSPLQVSWSVRPEVAKVNIASVANWCNDNIFDEDHAHGVRNLVVNPDLLSAIK